MSSTKSNNSSDIKSDIKMYQDYSFELLQKMIQCRTENFGTGDKTGYETKMVELILKELERLNLKDKFEIETLYQKHDYRKNIIIRWAGKNQPTARQNAILLNCHLDTVPASDQETGKTDNWGVAGPFEAEVVEGYLVGRGTADMKNQAAMALTVMRMLAEKNIRFEDRDVMFVGVADEENGQWQGSRWLCAEHPRKVMASLVISEGGGFNKPLGKGLGEFTPIGCGEKTRIYTRLVFKGHSSHGSMPDYRGNVIAHAGKVANCLGTQRLKYRLNPLVEGVIKEFAKLLPFPQNMAMRALASGSETLAYFMLDHVIPNETGKLWSAILGNTCAPTTIHGGKKVNVLAGEVVIECDVRVLPGSSPKEAMQDIKNLLKRNKLWDPKIFTLEDHSAEYETVKGLPAIPQEVVQVLREVLEANGAENIVPFCLPGATDQTHYKMNPLKKPISVGFQPLKIPLDADADVNAFHAFRERIPVDGFKWGTNCLWEAVNRFGHMSDEELGVTQLNAPLDKQVLNYDAADSSSSDGTDDDEAEPFEAN